MFFLQFFTRLPPLASAAQCGLHPPPLPSRYATGCKFSLKMIIQQALLSDRYISITMYFFLHAADVSMTSLQYFATIAAKCCAKALNSISLMQSLTDGMQYLKHVCMLWADILNTRCKLI